MGGEAKSPDDGGVKTLKLRGERSCVLIDVGPPRFLSSVDCYKVVDNGDSVDVVIEGKMSELPSPTTGTRFNHYIWIATGSKSETKIEDGTLIVYSPAFKSNFPKKEIDLMSCDQVKKKIHSDLVNFMCVEMGKLGRVVDPQDYTEMFNDLDEDEDAAEGKEDEDEDEAAAAGNKGKEKEDEAAAAVNKGKEKEAKKRKGKGKEAKKKRKRRSEEDEGEAKKEKR